MYQRQEFKDRESRNPNKRRITILEQNSNEMIANIEPVAEEIIEEGTQFNAELMGKFQESIIQSETDSGEALKIANEAKAQSQEAYNHVVSVQGTKITENGVFVASFDADKKLNIERYNTDKNAIESQIINFDNSKADKVTVNSEIASVKSRLGSVESTPVMTKIVYDASTNTFTF